MFTKSPSLSTDLSTRIPQKRSTFILFVHFGDQETTVRAIHSFLQGTVKPDHIVVVDHAETSFRAKDPSMLHVVRQVNTGYANGLRRGLQEVLILGARERDVCILANNDISVDTLVLEKVKSWWNTFGDSRTLAGPIMGYVSLLSGRSSLSADQSYALPWQIGYIHGSFVVGEYGFLASLVTEDPLFLYWEDVVWGMKANRKNGHLAHIPQVSITHNDDIQELSDSKLMYLVRNGAYVLEKNTSLPWRLYWYCINTLRMAYHSFRSGKHHRIILRALKDARLSRLGRVAI